MTPAHNGQAEVNLITKVNGQGFNRRGHMDKLEELQIRFSDPDRVGNVWQGSLSYNKLDGSRVRVICHLQDAKTDLKKPLDITDYVYLAVKADLIQPTFLFDLSPIGQTISFSNDAIMAETTFHTGAVGVGVRNAELTAETTCSRFYLNSPLIFSFIDRKQFDLKLTKQERRFTIKDRSSYSFKTSNKIFSEINFANGKSTSNSVNGDLAAIRYTGSLSLTPLKPMTLIEIVVISRLYEKILLLMTGSNCGPMTVTVATKKPNSDVCVIYLSSKLYEKEGIIAGLDRCWTLSKLQTDIGVILERSIADFSRIETSLELILDARSDDDWQIKFFKLTRALENIGRNLYPSGVEPPPVEIGDIEKLVQNNDALSRFFKERISPIFSRPNSLGYAIDFAKRTFAFWPVTELDKKDITRLRAIEAHARAHQFHPIDIENMRFYAEVLDFVCRASLLIFLGLESEDVLGGILPQSRFAWFAKDVDHSASSE